LIAQSLICFRTCIEVLRAESGLLSGHWHQLCEPQRCKLDSIASLKEHLSLYTQELSRVFFHKESVRLRQSWWLSAFYSFCIQSYVRRALVELTKDMGLHKLYEDIIFGQGDENSCDVPAKLKAAFALSCDHHNPEKGMSYTRSHLTNSFCASWRDLPTMSRKGYLRLVLPLSLSQLEEYGGTHTQNPLRQPRSTFDPILKRSELSPETVAGFGLKDLDVAGKFEADRYLHLPIRLFIALNRKAPDLIHADPIETDPSLRAYPFDKAREAVAYSDWHKKGILSSSDYLRTIFQDDGRIFQEISSPDGEKWTPERIRLFNRQRIPSCQVCMNFVHMGSPIATLPCSHWFHEPCIVAWLQEINICPSCDAAVYDETRGCERGIY
jgi:hypothetical protein